MGIVIFTFIIQTNTINIIKTMNLPKALKKFEKELSIFRTQGGLPQGQVRDALIDIYEEYWNQKKDIGPSTVKRGCSTCITDMMKALVNNLREESKDPKYYSFPKEPTTRTQTISVTSKEFEETTERGLEAYDIVDLSQLTKEELRLECKRRDIKYHHLHKEHKLIELLS